MAVNPNCHVIAVIGGKGGVGKSVYAANLSAANVCGEFAAATAVATGIFA